MQYMQRHTSYHFLFVCNTSLKLYSINPKFVCRETRILQSQMNQSRAMLIFLCGEMFFEMDIFYISVRKCEMNLEIRKYYLFILRHNISQMFIETLITNSLNMHFVYLKKTISAPSFVSFINQEKIISNMLIFLKYINNKMQVKKK